MIVMKKGLKPSRSVHGAVGFVKGTAKNQRDNMKWFSLLFSLVIICQSRGDAADVAATTGPPSSATNFKSQGCILCYSPPCVGCVKNFKSEDSNPASGVTTDSPRRYSRSRRSLHGTYNFEAFPRRPYDPRFEENMEPRLQGCSTEEIVNMTDFLVNKAYEQTRPVCLYTKTLFPLGYPLISAPCSLDRDAFHQYWLLRAPQYIKILYGNYSKPEHMIKEYIKVLQDKSPRNDTKPNVSTYEKIVCKVVQTEGREILKNLQKTINYSNFFK